MKFPQMPYRRPDLAAIEEKTAGILRRISAAASAEEQARAYLDFEALERETSTACTLASIRHTIDTRDSFYDQENDYVDEIAPALQELRQRISLALLGSAFRRELEERFGKLLFTNLEISARSMKPEIMPLMQEENRLRSEYQKLCASAVVDWEGTRLPLPRLGPFKESASREVRRRAYETEGRWYDSHREELDELYDRLVKNRTVQGRAMGRESFIPVAYDRLSRNCWDVRDAAAFREQIARDMVPLVSRVKDRQAKRLGLEKLKFFDDAIRFPDGNAVPQGSAGDILAAGREMYRQLSPQTAEFIDFLYDGELLDVLSREGKAPGGYCTELPAYKAPFIFSNFVGTSGDVDVLTHEAGHAFAAYRAARMDCLDALKSPTIEACECHSMSMEFLTASWHSLFFGPQTAKYERDHCEQALIFLPYGCMVDEFQQGVYEQPGLSPEERNRLWLDLERKYRPWTDFDGLPFYSRGAGWQRQLHIYQEPFYYLDYCMAQMVALQFWQASLANREDTWSRYLRFVDEAGTRTFRELVEDAGLRLPYAPGCAAEVGESVGRWLESNPM